MEPGFVDVKLADKSPSSRRAWVEIPITATKRLTPCVALLAEGVGRNSEPFKRFFVCHCRPPRGGRG